MDAHYDALLIHHLRAAELEADGARNQRARPLLDARRRERRTAVAALAASVRRRLAPTAPRAEQACCA